MVAVFPFTKATSAHGSLVVGRDTSGTEVSSSRNRSRTAGTPRCSTGSPTPGRTDLTPRSSSARGPRPRSSERSSQVATSAPSETRCLEISENPSSRTASASRRTTSMFSKRWRLETTFRSGSPSRSSRARLRKSNCHSVTTSYPPCGRRSARRSRSSCSTMRAEVAGSTRSDGRDYAIPRIPSKIALVSADGATTRVRNASTTERISRRASWLDQQVNGTPSGASGFRISGGMARGWA